MYIIKIIIMRIIIIVEILLSSRDKTKIATELIIRVPYDCTALVIALALLSEDSPIV